MTIRISIEDEPVRQHLDEKEYKELYRIFDGLEIDLPAVPYQGQTMTLAKDGIALGGTVEYAHLNWYAKGNGIFKHDEKESCYYFVRLTKLEVEYWHKNHRL